MILNIPRSCSIPQWDYCDYLIFRGWAGGFWYYVAPAFQYAEGDQRVANRLSINERPTKMYLKMSTAGQCLPDVKSSPTSLAEVA